MKKRILSLALAIMMIVTLLPTAAFAQGIEDPNVYVMQSKGGQCTLASCVMMLRRRAIIDGNADWESITESSLAPTATTDGSSLWWNFSYMGMSVKMESFSGSVVEKSEALKGMLTDHPEGIEIYDNNIPHAVLLTKYEDGVFYCADPATAAAEIPLANSWNATKRGKSDDAVIAGINQIWYITNKSGGGPGLVDVKLDANGGSAGSTRPTLNADATIAAFPTATRSGFKFLGWFDASDGGKQYTVGSKVTDGLTLYAHWQDLTIRGTTGSAISWSLNTETGALDIAGTGDMPNYRTTNAAVAPWAEYAGTVTSLTVEQGVTSIGNYAFADLDNLKTANIKSTPTRLGEGAFYGCSALTDIDGIESVRTIGAKCFEDCSSLSEIGIPSDCVNVGDYAFAKTAIKSLSVPASVQRLGIGAFSNCTALTYAEIPASLGQIPAECFRGCTAMTAFFVRSDIAAGAQNFTVSSNAFYGCSTLGEVGISSGAERLNIEKNAFAGCKGLDSMTLDALSLELSDNALPSGASIDYIQVSGDCGSISANAFGGVSATVLYPANGTNWDKFKDKNYGGNIVWQSYDNHIHNFVATVVEPTCSEGGYTIYECTECHQKVTGAVTKPLGHDFQNGVCTLCGKKNPFTDVYARGQHYYYTDGILWAVENNVTNGMSPTEFYPDYDCTRAQVVTFLWRIAGKPGNSGKNPFVDIAPGMYYYNAVLWASENGVTNGMDATHFMPDENVTRAQFVTLLWRYVGSPISSIENPFYDVPNGTYYYSAVMWAFENGVTNGAGAGFAPDLQATRAQVVTFLYRNDKLQ